MTKLKKLTVLALILGFTGIAGADNLDMNGTAGQNNVGPSSGTTQAKVESTFGSPRAKNAAVGDPPISSWEYDGFIVYFEYDRVIHSVKKR